MASLGFEVSADQLPQSQSYDAIPAGLYTAKVTDASLQDTKSGTGQYIRLRFDIMGPSHQGRVVFTNLNIRNQNPKAEEIGMQQMGDLMRAIGLPKVMDTDQFIGGVCQIKVTVSNSEQYGTQNEVKAFKAVEGGSPAPAPAQEAAGSQPPWRR